MSRLSIITPNKAQTVVEGLYRDVERMNSGLFDSSVSDLIFDGDFCWFF